jgi:CheY-like chemotaxis protein
MTAHAAANGSSLGGTRILVVDDNEINLDIAAESLLQSGAAVDSADSGDKALELIKQTKYDMVLLDLTMPGTDGMVVGKAIRSSAKNADTAVVVFTASDSVDALRAVRELSAQGLVAKPVDVDDLLAVVAKHVKRA